MIHLDDVSSVALCFYPICMLNCSMMETDYSDRITPDSVIRECDQYFLSAGVGSSHDICKHFISSVNQSMNGSESPDTVNQADEIGLYNLCVLNKR